LSFLTQQDDTGDNLVAAHQQTCFESFRLRKEIVVNELLYRKI